MHARAEERAADRKEKRRQRNQERNEARKVEQERLRAIIVSKPQTAQTAQTAPNPAENTTKMTWEEQVKAWNERRQQRKDEHEIRCAVAHAQIEIMDEAQELKRKKLIEDKKKAIEEQKKVR